MKVVMHALYAGPDRTIQVGEVADLPTLVAKQLIKRGNARPLDPPSLSQPKPPTKPQEPEGDVGGEAHGAADAHGDQPTAGNESEAPVGPAAKATPAKKK